MKCSKCGEECNENQAFCLKCGTPIQIVPDLNIIEEELANNVGELLEEIKEEESQSGNSHSAYYYDTGLEDNSDKYDTLSGFKPIQLDDDLEEEINRANIQKSMKDNDDESGYTVDRTEMVKKSRKKRLNEEEIMARNERKMFKVKVTCAIIAIFVVIVLAAAAIFWPTSGNKSTAFKTAYDKGMKYYNDGDYTNAVNEYVKAHDLASDKSSLKKVLTSLWDAYKKIDGMDMQQIDVIKELINVEPDNIDYYEELLRLYDKNGMVSEMDTLLKSVAGTDIASQLTEYSFLGPEFNYESGTYDQYIYIALSNNNGYKMYYTTDGTEPTTASTEYTDCFQIDKEGTTVVKAISVNEKGISSTVVTKEFEIKLSTLTAPTVTPDSGVYTSVKQIEVLVPEKCTAYYTLGENGSIPTEGSEKYTGPIDMPVGKNVFSVIVVNEQGVSSSVTQKIYELNVDRTYTYSQALDSLKTNLISSGFIIDSEGNTATGGIVEFSYVGVQVMEGNEYYLIRASSGENFGVGTVTGVIVSVTTNDRGIYEIAK